MCVQYLLLFRANTSQIARLRPQSIGLGDVVFKVRQPITALPIKRINIRVFVRRLVQEDTSC